MWTHVDRRHHQVRRRAALMASILLSGVMLEWTFAAERGDRQQGQRLYRRYCAVCHGIAGTGTGRNAPYLEQMGRAPRDHTDAWYMNRLSDAELYRAISQGKRREGEASFMPWWGFTLTEQEIWDLVAFIRGLAREPTE
jgi:mono/diheme cytochrome c family protein